MKILQVHNYYQQGGGEDVVVQAERELLQRNGHEVSFYGVSNDAVRGLVKKVQTAWRAPYCKESRDRFAAQLASCKPDLVHAHNLFPLLTPAVYDACQEAGVPVVQTLHNFRMICPGAYLLRQGELCEECLHGHAYRAGLYRCYRGSLLGSLAVARMTQYHRSRNTWRDKVDCFIALTEFSKAKFVQAGFPLQKIAVKPNFLDASLDFVSKGGNYALFVGRLSAEKGVQVLLDAWEKLAGKIPLKIVGDGPLAAEIAINAARLPEVELLGRKSGAEVISLMRNAQFLLFPSIWYEGFPMTILEAYSVGLPVIASDLGSMSSIVEPGRTGLHFRPGDPQDLAAKVAWALSHPDQLAGMRSAARAELDAKYTAERNYQMLIDIYRSTIEKKKSLSPVQRSAP